MIVAVDVETNGFDPAVHEAVEVAWWNLDSGEKGSFVPPHDPAHVLAVARPEALAANRYAERLANAPQDDGTKAKRMLDQLTGNTMAGANPQFDVRFLGPMFGGYVARGQLAAAHTALERLLDVSALAARVLGLRVKGLLGLPRLCALLDVEPGDHSAAGDVRAVGECLLALRALAPV